MDNFHFVNVKPSIERKEVSLIKETIFQRAREKAQQMNEEQNKQYTSEIKNDIMEIASADLRSSELNPFNQFKASMGLDKVESELAKTETAKAESATNQVEKPNNELSDNFKPLKYNIERISNNSYSNSVKDETMDYASVQFRQKNNLTASLNFLNAKAAVQMAKYAHSKINYMG